MEIAIIGLGKMGNEIAKHALRKGIKVVGLSNQEFPAETLKLGLHGVLSLSEMIKIMSPPRKVFMYVPAGHVVDEYIEASFDAFDEGDILVDGGNSYWGDSMRRHEKLAQKGIHFLDMGTSGGISGAKSGACFMVGGEKEAFKSIEPILEKLAAPDSYVYVGPSGCGHLVKLIHNGIEFGMLQAIGEGMALLERYKEDIALDMSKVFQAYRNGSVIRSWLIDLMEEQYLAQGGMKNVPDFIEDTGEVNWLINDALQVEVPLPVITQSIMELLRSRDMTKADYKAIAMMRHGFGGHPFGHRKGFKEGRLSSRIVNDFPWRYLNGQKQQ